MMKFPNNSGPLIAIALIPFLAHGAKLLHYDDFEGDFADRVG
ncbi:MAG: hypothetical protein QNL33_12475 [Akkermansiaceae bacterium]